MTCTFGNDGVTLFVDLVLPGQEVARQLSMRKKPDREFAMHVLTETWMDMLLLPISFF